MKTTKKWMAVCLSLVLLCMTGVSAFAAVGDIDADDKVTASDARLALRAAVGLETLPDSRPADADHDEKITAADARLILRAAVGLETLTHPAKPEGAAVTVTAAPTCTEGGKGEYVCVCGETLTVDLPALGHAAGEAVRENEVPATCTADGKFDTATYCVRCGVELSRKTETLKKTGHKAAELPAVAATCTATGLTKGSKCEICGEILTAQKEVPALGHDIVLDRAASTYSLTGKTSLRYRCSRCDATWENDPALLYTGKFGSDVTEQNMEIFNYFVNRLKTDWSAQGIKISSVDHAVSTGQILSSKYDMNWLMKSKVDAINLALGDDEKIPTKKSEFDAMLQEMMAGTNETQNSTVWPVVLTNDNFVLKATDAVSRLTAADVASITVETVTGYPGVGGFLPDILPNTRTISMKDDGSFWIVGTPGDYNLKDMFLARLPDAESAVKVTLKLKDGNFNSMDAFVKNANLKRIIDINEKDFEMEDITTAFDGMDSIGTFDVKQSNTIKTGGTISYFFEPETGKPLAATYDTGIDTVNTFTMNIKIALSTLDAGASISANSHTKTIYIFDPKLVY